MFSNEIPLSPDTESINRGFSKQSRGYDSADRRNIILQDLRRQVYRHTEYFLRPSSHILELNAGTGIDAEYFVSRGHRVHATDLSDGMIAEIRKKILAYNTTGQLSCQQLSFEHLDEVSGRDFDHVFSNFGGLNCIDDLSKVTRHLPKVLRPGGYVTWVVMPPVCPWEMLWLLKGHYKQALRRLSKNGVIANVEGERVRTYYHSLSGLRAAFGESFTLKKCEGLAALSPQPHHYTIPLKFPRVYYGMRRIDSWFRHTIPFNRWADHIIATFQYNAG